MTTFRSVLAPSILLSAFLLALASLGGPPTPPAEAFGQQNHICQIDGPTEMAVGETALYAWRVQDNLEDILGELAEPDVGLEGLEDEFTVEIDSLGGDGKITNVVQEDDSTDEAEEGFELDEYISVGPTNELNDVDVEGPDQIDEDLLEFLEDRFGYELEANPCGTSAAEVAQACIDEGFCNNFAAASSAQIDAWADALESEMSAGEADCVDLGETGDDALVDAGFADAAGRNEIQAFWLTVCNFSLPGLPGPILDDAGFVAVTCFEAGRFKISFADKGKPKPEVALQDFNIANQAGDVASLTVNCRGEVSAASMVALPTPVEIIPQLGSVAHSFITVTLLDSIGGPAVPGGDVLFITDRCAIESSAVDDEESFESAEAVFNAFDSDDFASAAAVEGHIAATTSPVGDPMSENVETFSVFGASGAERVVAATVLHCDTSDGPGTGPGPALITAFVERPGQDLVLSVVVDVVGPPVPGGLSVAASPTTLVCGEKSRLDVMVLDAIGQPVSDYTPVEAVTNFGGVLGGTGAVAAGELPVTPLSSTKADTFGGIATFFLITSDEHVGNYEVVVTTGGTVSGAASGAPFSAQVSVECILGDPAEVVAPTNDITPPSTGDAGLAGRTERQGTVFFAAGIAAFALAGLAIINFARD